MKYLVILRGFNEPDNNTPSDEIWAKVVDIEMSEMVKCEKVYTSEFEGDYANSVSVDFYPLDEMDNEWVKVSEIW